MNERRRPRQWKLALFLAVIVALASSLVWLASGPNYEVRFQREIPSSLTLEQLDEALRTLEEWPAWHVVTQAVVVDSESAPSPQDAPSTASSTAVREGLPIRFFIESPKKQWKRFEIRAQVLEYVPRKRLRVKFAEDSHHKIDQLFEHLEWSVELQPVAESGNGLNAVAIDQRPARTLVRGSLIATTRNWRSRLFGRIARRILMNQVLYVDVKALAQFKQPSSKPASAILKE